MEGRPGDPPVALPVARLSHRKVVREGDEGDAGGHHPALHGERNGGYAAPLDGLAYQAHGPVAERSGGRQQDGVDPVLNQLAGHLGGGPLPERARLVDRAHKREVAVVEGPDLARGDEVL